MGMKKYFTEVVREGKRVRWPSTDQLLPALGVVLVIAIFTAVFLMIEDLASGVLIQQLRIAFESMRG